jgi:hypothetical protein
MDKLTPMGSQGEDYGREEVAMEVDREIFDSNMQTPANMAANKENRGQRMVVDSVSDNASAPQYTDLNARKRPPPPEPLSRASKRTGPVNNISEELRQQTVETFLRALNPLSEQEGVSDLVAWTAKRLEHDLFDKVSKGRPVNALGRSSTLVTASRKTNLADKYDSEKEKLLRKVEQYVTLASRNDVELEQVQQGEIWETIKKVLDGDS